jgi:hypothetical protein
MYEEKQVLTVVSIPSSRDLVCVKLRLGMDAGGMDTNRNWKSTARGTAGFLFSPGVEGPGKRGSLGLIST